MADRKIGPPHEHILGEDVADELLLLDTRQDTFISMNAPAGDVWRLATGEFTIDEIVERLASFYDSEPERIRQDVESTIEDFVQRDLIPKP